VVACTILRPAATVFPHQPEVVEQSGDALEATLSPLLADYVQKTNYDFLSTMTNFLIIIKADREFDSCLRLVSAILIEFNDDWSTGRRLFST